MPGVELTFVRFSGKDGLELELTMPKQRLFDYTVMFWFRSHKTYDELLTDETILNKKARLFELPGAVACSITRTSTEDPHIVCNTRSDNLKLSLAKLPNLKAWMHLTFAANYGDDYGPEKEQCYIRVDDLEAQGKYPPMQDRRAYLSSGFDYMDGNGNPDGFPGDYRQFWYAMTFIEPDRIKYQQHEEKALDFRVRAYYKFDDPEDKWRDDFREQHAEPVGDKEPQILTEPGRIVPLCSSLPQQLVELPAVTEKVPLRWKKIQLYTLKDQQREFGYTLSLWIRNYGTHGYSTNPRVGRESYHLFEKSGSFALWWDSPISFRIYIYARSNFYEFYTSAISVPLRDWVNIQVAISHEGIQVMTFNENGQRLQYLNLKEYLAEQYIEGHMTIFDTFQGVPYRLQFWEEKHELPIEQDKAFREDINLVADINFARTDPSEKEWALFDGTFLVSETDPNFKIIYDKVPSDVSYDPDEIHGTIESEQTVWNGVSCPDPTANQIYLAGKGAGLIGNVVIERTTEYSVEFWFRPDWSKKAEVMSNTYTYLFQLSDTNFKSSMVIYIRNGELKCSPYGLNSPYSLLYEGINPFSVAKWQHLSCVFAHEKYIKGHYLAVNLDEDGPLPDFEKMNMNAQTFYKDIHFANAAKDNFNEAVEFSVIVGNDRLYGKIMNGSFKEIKLWSRARTDKEIFKERFLQSSSGDKLKVSYKLIDGSPVVLNSASSNSTEVITPQNVLFVPSDKENLVCPAESYFDVRTQVCTNYPYTGPAKIIYTNTLMPDGNYAITLTSIIESTFLLPGSEPRTDMRWTSDYPNLIEQAIGGSQGNVINLDFQQIQNGAVYNFEFTKTGADFHNFFVRKSQKVIPVLCHQLVDKESDEAITSKKIVIGNEPPELWSELDDFCFEFQLKEITDLCPNIIGFKVLGKYFLETVPKLEQSVLDQVSFSYDRETQTYKSCLPHAAFEQSLPQNRPITFIFTAIFEHVGQTAYMNVAYEVAVVKEIAPGFKFLDNHIDVGSQTSLFINATDSAYIDGSTGRFSFTWECGQALQQYCDRWTDSPFIHFSNSGVTNYVTLGEEVVISVVVSSFESGGVNPAFGFRKSDKFKWSNQSKPQFEIILLSGPKINVSQTTKFSLAPKNFRLSDPGYIFEFALTPSDQYDDSRVEQSAGRTMLIVQPGAFKYGTTYQLEVLVTNTNIQDATPATQKILFETGPSPTVNALEVDPPSGSAFDTEFTITISNYTTDFDDGLKYVLYGTNVGGQENIFRITTQYEELDMVNNITTVKMRLPEISSLTVRVRDINKEYIDFVKSPVSVVDGGNNVIELLQRLKATYTNLSEEFWRLSQLIAQNTNRYGDEGRFTSEKVIEVNVWISNEAKQTLGTIPVESTEENQLKVIRNIIMAVDHISDWKVYNDETSIRNCIDVSLDIIERTAALDLLLQEKLFTNDLIDAIGDLFDLTASRASYEQGNAEAEQRRRFLQDGQQEGGSFTTSVADLFKLKNTLMDILCKQASSNGVLNSYQTEALDVYVQKVKSDFSRFPDSQFVSMSGNIQVTLPLEAMLNYHKLQYSEFQELCIQVSFTHKNPVPAVPNFEVVEDSYVAHMKTVDNLGNRIVHQDSGFSDPRGASVQIYFEIDPNDYYMMQSPQVKCMHIQAGTTGAEGSDVWSDEGCTYKIAKVGLTASVTCVCDSLHDYYYALVLDKTVERGLICPGDPECPENIIKREKPDDRQKTYIILISVLLPLFLMGTALPIWLSRKDAQDYKSIETSQLKMSAALCRKFQHARGLSCIQKVYYKEILLHSFLDIIEPDGRISGVLRKTQHPLLSMISYYDYRMSRITRFTFVLGQVSLITILVFAAYSEVFHEWFGDDTGFQKMLWIAAPLGIFTIPLPQCCLRCLETDIYDFKDELDPMMKAKQKEAKFKEHARMSQNPNAIVQPQDINLDFDHGIEQTTDVDEGPRATLIETCMHGKRCLLVIVYIFWLIALGSATAAVYYMHEINEPYYFQRVIELDNHDAGWVAGTWWLAVFVSGYGIFNFIRLTVIDKFATKQAEAIKKKYEEDLNKRKIKQGAGQEDLPMSCVARLLIPKRSVEIMLDILFMIDILNNPDKFMPEDIFDPVEESDKDEKTDKKDKKKKNKGKKGEKSELELTKTGKMHYSESPGKHQDTDSKLDDQYATQRIEDENVNDDQLQKSDMGADATYTNDLLKGRQAPLRKHD